MMIVVNRETLNWFSTMKIGIKGTFGRMFNLVLKLFSGLMLFLILFRSSKMSLPSME